MASAICTIIQASFAVLFVVACYADTATGATINIINQCTYPITAYRLQGAPSVRQSFPLKQNGRVAVNIGQTKANLIWASSSNNANQGQASALEITVNGAGGNDFYDISLVNAYNLNTKIQPINIPAGAAVGGFKCGAPSCSIGNPAGFCQSPNRYGSSGGGSTGKPSNYGEYCINTAGPGLVSTAGTKAFKARCPNAYSYSKDDASSTYTCKTGANYNFIYCP